MLILLDKISWVQYMILVLIGSLVGELLMEVLIRFKAGVREAVEELEKQDGLKRGVLGISVTILPLVCKAGFHLMGAYEPMMKWCSMAKWPLYIFLACYFIGAVWLVVGFVMLVLSIRHG